MPRRDDLNKILMIGSGPVIIGQACEFDYSGSQACKALLEEDYEVVLINSNPATIMTDPVMAHHTYIEPITPEIITKIIEKERPDAVLPTLGGQTGLNAAIDLDKAGVFTKYGVEVLGCNPKAISVAEDREEFKNAMIEIGLRVPESGIARNMDEAMELVKSIGLPVIVRPAFTMGGTGGSTIYNTEEAPEMLKQGMKASPAHEVLIEESVIGWKEIEFEVMRDCADNVILITSMENVDPMGVHTGDSAVVAPAQTLTAADYSTYVDICHRIIRRIGVQGGGINIQLGGDPESDDIVIIEVNPRLSRSSALASKATGFPIARVATKLAVGYTLDEVTNDVTGSTYTVTEPIVDYCVFKAPRFTFEKFPATDRTINTSMKSVGESMSIGRNFKEAFQKGLRSLETGSCGFGGNSAEPEQPPEENLIVSKLAKPNDERLTYVRHAFRQGFGMDRIQELTRMDRWFLNQFKDLVEFEQELSAAGSLQSVSESQLRKAKRWGYSNKQLANILKSTPTVVRSHLKELGIRAAYKLADTCAGEVEASNPYFYSTHEQVDESRASENKKIMILGGGPNRIGQGIEFDYCCVHAALAVKEKGYEAVMVNCNPETVSTDYDTSDRLYFEPMTAEDVLNVVDVEKPDGVVLQFGGQTPLNIAAELKEANVPLLGTSVESINLSEDRKEFKQLLERLDLKQAPNGTATSYEEAFDLARKIGYPILVRPSYVLGGRAMEIIYDEADLEHFMTRAVDASPRHPVLIDKFLEDSVELDVDAISDGENIAIGAIMEHIEEAGVHSGDSACVIPPQTVSKEIQSEIKRQTEALAKGLNVNGLVNIQFAVRDSEVYVIEVNPRASRTIPFVSKATGVPLAKLATKGMLGDKLPELGLSTQVMPEHVSVKEAVFPFTRFPGIDTLLSPEMKSTGEVMGIADDFGLAFAKAQLAAGQRLPRDGNIFFSLRDRDKNADSLDVARSFEDLGFELCATEGTCEWLCQNGICATRINKVREGRPHIVDKIIDGEIELVINTPSGKHPREDEVAIRRMAWAQGVATITTVQGAIATAKAIMENRGEELTVGSLQEYTERLESK